MKNIDRRAIKQEIREALRGNVWHYFLPALFASVLLGATSIATAILEHIFKENPFEYLGIIGVAYSILLIPVSVGLALYYINATKNEESFGNLFGTFGKNYSYGVQLGATILSAVYIMLGTICLIVPGIILAFRYCLINYVLADYPELGVKEAMKKCKEITKGRMGELFCLFFSFFWWLCLVGLTFGLAAIYVLPYMELTTARFYLDAKKVVERDNEVTTGDYIPPQPPVYRGF